ncbi:MAG: hypothetical protein AAF555_06175 [Verrucomicrobiota bacterium]
MKSSWWRWTGPLTAVFLGLVLLYFFVSRRAEVYLAPDFLNYLLFGGCGLLVLATFVICTRETAVPRRHAPSTFDLPAGMVDEEDPSSSRMRGLSFGILLLPLWGAILLTEDEFSEEVLLRRSAGGGALPERPPAMERVGEYTEERFREEHAQTPSGHFRVDAMELFYVAGDEGLMPIFKDKPVQVEAQVLALSPSEPRMWMYELMMTCCSADARPFGFPIEFDGGEKPEIPSKNRVRVTGILGFEMGEDGYLSPVIQVESIEDLEAESSGRSSPTGPLSGF